MLYWRECAIPFRGYKLRVLSPLKTFNIRCPQLGLDCAQTGKYLLQSKMFKTCFFLENKVYYCDNCYVYAQTVERLGKRFLRSMFLRLLRPLQLVPFDSKKIKIETH